MSPDFEGIRNFDNPEAIDQIAYINHVRLLSEGTTVERKEYNFYNKNISPKILKFFPAPIVIFEGIFSLYFEECNNILDLKIFIEAHQDKRLDRRIKRDINERGYSQDEIIYRWKNHVIPYYEDNSQTYRDNADLIINNNNNYEIPLKILTTYLRNNILSNNF